MDSARGPRARGARFSMIRTGIVNGFRRIRSEADLEEERDVDDGLRFANPSCVCYAGQSAYASGWISGSAETPPSLPRGRAARPADLVH